MGRYKPSTLDIYWAYRQRDSLRAAVDRRAAKELLEQIYEWSAKQKQWGENAGSWVTDMEFTCWKTQTKLHALAEKAGGWWRWCNGVVFVPLGQWRPMFDLWLEIEQAHRIYLKGSRRLDRFKRPKHLDQQQDRWMKRWEQGK